MERIMAMTNGKTSKALVVYSTRSGQTKDIAELIAEGIRFEGLEAEVKNITGIKKESDLEGYDGYVFGSATYHGEMMQGMKTMLFLAEKAPLEDKVGGSFGAFGWSGEAPDRIFDTMANIFKMNMVSGPLRLKSASLGGGIQMAQGYGREVGKKLSES
jgi:flavorubredoxin